MKTRVYSVYDKLALEYSPIFHSPNDACAARSVARELRKSDSAEDYEVFCLGCFDHNSGKFELFEVPEEIHVSVAGKMKIEVVERKLEE